MGEIFSDATLRTMDGRKSLTDRQRKKVERIADPIESSDEEEQHAQAVPTPQAARPQPAAPASSALGRQAPEPATPAQPKTRKVRVPKSAKQMEQFRKMTEERNRMLAEAAAIVEAQAAEAKNIVAKARPATRKPKPKPAAAARKPIRVIVEDSDEEQDDDDDDVPIIVEHRRRSALVHAPLPAVAPAPLRMPARQFSNFV